jgi:hypothetical protein
MRDFLSEQGFFATEKELALLMHKFDKFGGLKITLSDFIDELVPKTQSAR